MTDRIRITCAKCQDSTLWLEPEQNAGKVLDAHGWKHDRSGIFCSIECQNAAQRARRTDSAHTYLDASGHPNDPALQRVQPPASYGASALENTGDVVVECCGSDCGGIGHAIEPARVNVPRANFRDFLRASGWSEVPGHAGHWACSVRCATSGLSRHALQ